MNTVEQLKVGAFVGPDILIAEDFPIDIVDARVFVHPGIPNRQVVRLTPQALGEGEDAALEIMGFGLTEVARKIAQKKRQALGFPDWVLLNDPAHAADALVVTRKLRKEARRAASKPGNAKIAFDALADEIAKKTPSFLPTFFEEIGRVFVTNGNTQYAAMYFGKAREAEQKFALTVDEDRRRDVFVEFALSGAVTNKAMTDYAKDLAARYGDARAYEIWVDVCVRRTLGGSPLSPTLLTDLKKLAKAAGKKPADAEQEFIEMVWDAPSLSRSSEKLWRAFEPGLVRLSATEPRLKHHLLGLFPNAISEDDFAEFWGQLLQKSGSIDVLKTSTNGAAASWIVGMANALGGGWYSGPRFPQVGFEICRDLAPRLREDAVPVKLAEGESGEAADPDLVDLLLELGVPVELGEQGLSFRVWSRLPENSNEHGRELTFLSKYEPFAGALNDALGYVMSDEDFHQVARGKAGLTALRRAWLLERINDLEFGNATVFSDKVSEVMNYVPAFMFQEFPEAFQKIQAIDESRAIFETLRQGFIDEFGWPAAHAAWNELKVGPDDEVHISGVFPYLVLHNTRKAFVIGDQGRVFEHDFKVKKDEEIEGLRFVDGQLLVNLYNSDYDLKAYWSGDAKKRFDGADLDWEKRPAAHLSDGHVVEGGRAYRAGEKNIPDVLRFLADGQSFWVRTRWREPFVEYNPFTGETGRASLPSVVESQLQDGWELDTDIVVYPVPSGTPLGHANGVFFRLHFSNDDGSMTRTPQGAAPRFCEGMLTIPGAGLVTVDDGPELYSLDDKLLDRSLNPIWNELDFSFFHHFRALDEAASNKLRHVEPQRVERLVQLAKREDSGEEMTRELVDFLGDSPLVPAVIERIKAHGAEIARLNSYIAQLDENAAAPREIQISDIDVWTAYADLANGGEISHSVVTWSDDRDLFEVLDQLHGFFFHGQELPKTVPKISTRLGWILRYPGTLAWLAAHQADATQPNVLKGLLQKLTELSWFASGDKFTEFKSPEKAWKKLGWEEGQETAGITLESCRFFVSKDRYDDDVVVLAFHPDGLKLPKGVTRSEEVSGVVWDGEIAQRAIEALSEYRPFPFELPLVQRLAGATGLSPAEAALVWSVFKGAGSWRAEPFDSETRKALKLKVKEVELALEALRPMDGHVRSAIYHEGLPADFGELFAHPEQAVDTLAAAWSAHTGGRESFPTELLTSMAKEGGFDDPRHSLSTLKNPPVYSAAGKVIYLKKEKRLEIRTGENSPGSHEFEECVALVNYMFGSMPVGDTYRNAAPALIEGIFGVLQQPDFLLQVDSPLESMDDDELDAFLSRLGETHTVDGHGYFDDGVAVVIRGRWGAEVAVRTSAYLQGKTSAYANPDSDGLVWLASLERATRLADRIKSSSLKTGQFEANPSHSAPDLLAEVTSSLGVSTLAAMAFLQTLALPEPTLANLKLWNNWSPSEIKKAFTELVEKKLVLEAKRARAGRPYFVDGPWLDSRFTTPVEAWKVSMYGPEMPTRHRLLAAPCHELFALAWQRWTANDRPGF